MARRERGLSSYEPGPAAWRTVAAAVLRVVAELAGQGVQVAFFTLRRGRWQREIGALVCRDPLPVAIVVGSGVSAGQPRRTQAPLRLVWCILCSAALLTGCASRQVGTKSSWELLNQGHQSSAQELSQTVRLLEGGNDWADVAQSARMLDRSREETGFGAIRDDLGKTFAPPFSFEDLRSTFRLLR
jgi:hypothetical protein